MTIRLTDISTIFNHLRDGLLKSINFEEGVLSFELYIPHLARYHNPEHKSFFVSLFDVTDAYLIPWGKNDSRINDLNGLEENRLHILSADLNPFEYIELQTEAEIPNKYISDGGMMFIKAKSCKIYDEEFNRLELDQIMSISQDYWKSKRTNE